MKNWQPHEFQLNGIKLLLGQGSAGLLFDPGLGKTSVCLAAFKILKEKGLVERMLVVAPLRPMYNSWPGEIEKWAEFNELTYSILHGKDKKANARVNADIYLINPEGLLNLLRNRTEDLDYISADILCVDESTRFKSHSTARFKELKKHLARFKRRWILTGTFVPNGIMDMFGQVYILDQGGSLGRYITHYRNNYFHQNPWDEYTWIPNENAYEQISEKIAPLVMRLDAETYLDMPALVNVTVEIELPPKSRVAYREVEKDFITMLEEGALIAANAAAVGTKLRQIANGAVYTENPEWVNMHDAKLEALESLFGEILPSPCLVLYEFKHDLQKLKAKFPDAISITGLNPSATTHVINEFNAGRIQILLGHPASMGEGLNLQEACHHVIWFGIPWNFFHYDQATRRIYRQGQSERVFVYHIVAKDTKDEDVMGVLSSKEKTQKDLYSALCRKRDEIYG